MTLQDFLMFSAVASAVSAVAHWFVRRYWLAVAMSALGASVINIADEFVKRDFAVRPSDAAFWIPMFLMMGIVVALPVVAIIGIPFYVIRRRKQSNVD